MNSLHTMKPLKEENDPGLQGLLDSLNHHREALQALGQPVKMWDTVFEHIACKIMDTNTRLEWEEYGSDNGEVPSISELSEFLRKRVRILSATEMTRAQSYQKPAFKFPTTFNYNKEHTKTNKSATITATLPVQECSICQGPHYVSRCSKLTQISPVDCRKLVENHKLCYNCIGKNHSVKKCPSKGVCRKCQERHHTLLHNSKRPSSEP